MSKIKFAIIGGGWRTTFFLNIARALPKIFEVCGMVVRDEAKSKLIETEWGVTTYRTIDQLLAVQSPSFVLVCVSKPAVSGIIRELTAKGTAVLSETPPALDLDDLAELNKLVDHGAKIQVSEQYHLQPLHAARLSVARSGLLGSVSEVQISVCHDYHAMSLARKFLRIDYENAEITPYRFDSPIVDGPDYLGIVNEERIVQSKQTIALLNFGGKLVIYDFTNDQYFSWIRSLRLLVRGDRGEINDEQVKYLQDHRTPIEFNLLRQSAGENGNLEGYYLKGILAGQEWAYKNPFAPGRISDDEIAMASCLAKMDEYVNGGPEFYSLAEASQDHYLGLMIEKAVKSGQVVKTEHQPWSRL